MTEMKTASRTAAAPMIAYEDAGAAVEWLARAYGFQEDTSQRYVGPDGRVGHAQMETDRGGVIMLASPTPEYQSPRHHREECEAADRWSQVPWVIDGVQVEVDDVDAHRDRAEAAGARMLTPLRDEPYGRLYNAEDLEGHRWMFIQPA
jgi:uncharacterized glyoxalase superfamily protein PhnB